MAAQKTQITDGRQLKTTTGRRHTALSLLVVDRHLRQPQLWLPQVAVNHQKGEGSVTPSSRRLELSTISYLRFLRRHRAAWVTQLRQLRLLLSALLRPRRATAIWRGFKRAG